MIGVALKARTLPIIHTLHTLLGCSDQAINIFYKEMVWSWVHMSCKPFLNPDKRTLIGRFSGKPTKTTKVDKLWQQNIFNYSSHILKQQLASTLLFTWRPFGTCSVRSFVRLRPSGVCRWVTRRRVTVRPPWPACLSTVSDTYGSSTLIALTISLLASKVSLIHGEHVWWIMTIRSQLDLIIELPSECKEYFLKQAHEYFEYYEYYEYYWMLITAFQTDNCCFLKVEKKI